MEKSLNCQECVQKCNFMKGYLLGLKSFFDSVQLSVSDIDPN